MKIRILVILFFALIVQIYNTYGQGDTLSKIVFIREYNTQREFTSYKILVNDTVANKLYNSTYFEYPCTAGNYILGIDKYPDSFVKLDVKENQTYYVFLTLKMKSKKMRPELVLMDSTIAITSIQRNSLKELKEYVISPNRPPHRIALEGKYGLGVKEIPMYVTQDYQNANISFGGGYALGLKYGYEFNKYIDLAGELSYQLSMLRPSLNNAYVTFERGIASITPSYIINIQEGELIRFKIGVGYSYYFSNLLSIDESEISAGSKAKFDYKNTDSYHFSAIAEMYNTSDVSVYLGIKIYEIEYELIPNKSVSINESVFGKPNGSGFDAVFGLFYNF